MTKRGEVMAWMFAHVSHDADECLIFPYCRNPQGYGGIGIGGRKIGAHRVMATLAHGEPPTPKHEAAHSCGNGHLGCVNPKHLRWATFLENQAEKAIHQSVAGERNARAYLTEKAVLAMRELAHTVSPAVIADLFGTNRNRVYDILLRRTWRHV